VVLFFPLAARSPFSGLQTILLLQSFCRRAGKLAIILQILHLLRSNRVLSLDLRPIWVIWVSRALLQKAEALSKAVDTDNWFDPVTVDLFAVADNAKVARVFFFSFEAGCSGVDAFSFSWDGEWAYLLLLLLGFEGHKEECRFVASFWSSFDPFVAVCPFLVLCFSRRTQSVHAYSQFRKRQHHY
jgi:hypothetical protein